MINFISELCLDTDDKWELNCVDSYYWYEKKYSKDPIKLCTGNENSKYKKQCCKTCEGMFSLPHNPDI